MWLCFVLFLGAVAACLATGHSLIWALLAGLVLFSLLGLRRGFGVRALAAMAWAEGKKALIVVPVFLLIGTVTALWRASGTIAFFLHYGLRSIPPASFLLMAFLLSAALSFALGTSFGVVGTAGVVLITLARSGGVDLAVTAGAVVSGAYFGDRCSPMSSCAALVAAVTGTELYRNVREMLRTALLPTVLTAALFALLSVRRPMAAGDEAVLEFLRQGFALRWLVLLPAALMLALPLLRVPVKAAMAASAAAALALAILLQGLSPWAAVRAALLGYVPAGAELRAILSGGGLVSMLPASATVFLTSLYAGILDGTGALAPFQHAAERLADRAGLFPAAAAVSLLSVMVFCNQSVMVLLDEQLLRSSYERRRASRETMAMDIANSGVTLAGLVPWSIACSLPLSMLGVGMEAIPWCALLYLIPLCYFFTRRYFLAGQEVPSHA